jgi:hypothetical protein
LDIRCGLIKLSEKEEVVFPEREKLARIDIDEETKTMNIEFLEPVDWEKLRSE